MLNEDDLRPGDLLQDAKGDFWHVHEDGKIWHSKPENRISFETANGSCGPFTYPLGSDPKRNKNRDSEDNSMKNTWTRDDFPASLPDAEGVYGPSILVPSVRRDLASWLNAHHPKPQPYDQGGVRGADSLLYRAERERDAAVARADAAEKRHTWPKVTPTGHTYVEPRTYEALCHEHDNAAQAAVECWAADECPPEPTWEMVGIAHREVERLQRERDEWKARAEKAERERDAASKRADEFLGLLSVAAQRVSEEQARAERAESERDAWHQRAESAEWGMGHLDRRWSDGDLEAEVRRRTKCLRDNLHGVTRSRDEWERRFHDLNHNMIDREMQPDPAVFVVRESDIAAVEVEKGVDGREWSAGDYSWLAGVESHELRHGIPDTLGLVAAKEAIARAIEAEATVDPVEELATRFKDAARDAVRTTLDSMTPIAPALADFDAGELVNDISPEQWRTMARNVIAEQEAGDE